MKGTLQDQVEFLIFNYSFRKWVLFGDDQERLHWENYGLEHPDAQQAIDLAVSFLNSIKCEDFSLSDDEVNIEVKRIISILQASTPQAITPPTYRLKFYQTLVFKAAAVFLLISTLVFAWYQISSRQDSIGNANNFAAAGKNEYLNNTAQSRTILLSDGSTVVLEKNSKLVYSNGTAAESREAYLLGKAFFSVKRDPSKPFIVYTKSLVTKVLGTSFTISAYASDPQATVVVKTGKVSVFKTIDFSDNNKKPFELSGLIVTPNQQVTYSAKADELNKQVVSIPAVLAPVTANEFSFKATPLSNVFKLMQHVYGINILYDEELLSNCTLTASFSSESFYEKLDLICKSFNAQYQIIEGNVVISAAGCK